MARWWRRDERNPAPPSAQSATSSSQPAVPPPVQRAAWRDLPPIRSTLTSTPPIAPRDSFTASLATSRNPSFLAPLGHVVDPEGPSGHVDGLASPAVPQTISAGPPLPVAQRQAASSSSVTSVMQRALTPSMWFADNAERTATPAPTQSEPTFSVPAEQQPVEAVDTPRQLDAVAPMQSRASFTSAPDQDVARSLPVVAAPAPSFAAPSPAAPTPAATTSAAPTVSRSVTDEPAVDVIDELATPEPVAADSSPPMAPLLGGTSASTDDHPTSGQAPQPSPEASPFPSGSSTSAAATPVQRSVTTDSPVRRPGLGAPLPSPSRTSGATATPLSPLQRVATPGPRSVETPAAPLVQRSAAAPSDHPHVHEHSKPAADPTDHPGQVLDAPVLGMSTLMRAVDPAEPAGPSVGSGQPNGDQAGHLPVATSSSSVQRASRPMGLGAPLEQGRPLPVASQTPASVQRDIASTATGINQFLPTSVSSQPSAPNAAGGSSTADAPTVGQAGPLGAPFVGAETAGAADPSPGADGSAVPQLELNVAAPVQRAADLTPAAASSPDAGPQRSATGQWSPSAESNGDAASIGSPTGSFAPLLGGGPDLPGAAAMPSTGAAVQRSSSAAPGAVVQRAATTNQPAAPLQNTPAPLTGFGAPISAVPSTAGDRAFTAREMSLQRMFEPGAAAIASGAAYSDGGNSVVFRPPANSPSESAGPTSSPLQTLPTAGSPFSSGPSSSAAGPAPASLPLARSAMAPLSMLSSPPTNPTLGSSFGGAQSVQRFGLPGVSSLSGMADTARQAAGGYADTARSTASGYLNQASGAAGNAASAAGGYLDSARSAAGGYLDSAADSAAGAASGYLASARSAVGGVAEQAVGVADQAGAAAGNAASAAQGAVGGAIDSVSNTASNAAGGIQAAAGDAVSGATSAVAGAVGAAGGAAAGAAGALPTDLDELARRLFDPLSARFKTELWLDRERAGMVTDLRR